MGWSPEDTDLVTDYLANEELIEFMGGGDGGQVSITHPGIREVEEALGGSGEATDHFSTAAIMVVQGDVHNSQFQLGTQDSQQFQESITTADSEALRVFIERIETSLSQMNLTQEQELDAVADIATVRAQLQSPRPKRRILKEAVRSLRSLVEGVGGNVAFAGLLELARQIQL